jgi:hypothetical protein
MPDAHSATMALAALMFRSGDRAGADERVVALLSRAQPAGDPWWLYWPADYRFGPSRIQAMREALQ